MDSVIKIGKRGVITLPEEIWEKIRLKEGDMLLANVNPDGSITLRPALPAREYTEEELQTFAEEDELPPELAAGVRSFLER